jgi:hypothetical protein
VHRTTAWQAHPPSGPSHSTSKKENLMVIAQPSVDRLPALRSLPSSPETLRASGEPGLLGLTPAAERTLARLVENRGLLRAELVYDSWQHRSENVRRGLATSGRQLAFCTQTVDIALTLMARPNRTITVAGQLFPTSDRCDAFDIEMVGDGVKTGEVHQQTHADELGEFWLDGLPSGAYHLILTTSQMGILVTPVELPELTQQGLQ